MRRPRSEPARRRPLSGPGGDLLRRTVAVLAVAAGALAGALLAGPATAQSADCGPNTAGTVYPMSSCMVMTSSNVVGVGGSLTVSGDGFKPLSSVSVQLHSAPVSLGSLTSNAAGSVDGAVKIPETVPSGTHQLQLTGVNPDGSPRVLAATVQIGSQSTSSSGLTGWFWVGIGILVAVLLIIAALMARSGRRRQAG